MEFRLSPPKPPWPTTKLVVPLPLQIGWLLSPPFFCASSESAQDLAALYVCEMQGALPEHSLDDSSMPDEEFILLDMSNILGKAGATFPHML